MVVSHVLTFDISISAFELGSENHIFSWLGGGYIPRTEHVSQCATTKCFICHEQYVPQYTHAS